jgi:pimeloyl-ACP methyl ester carboxylesterase
MSVKLHKTPILTIMSKKDSLTPNPRKLYKKWAALSDVVNLYVLDKGSHYFITERADLIAEFIVQLSHDYHSVANKGGKIFSTNSLDTARCARRY